MRGHAMWTQHTTKATRDTRRGLAAARGAEAGNRGPDAWQSAGRRGDVEQGKGERVAPGVTKQRLVNADARWGDTGTTENLSRGQQRPSSLRGPGPKTPRAPRPAGSPILEVAKQLIWPM